MLKNKTALSLSPLALLTLAACGGTTSSGVAVKGTAQNGPLENAWAFLDLHHGVAADGTFKGDGIFNSAADTAAGITEVRVQTSSTGTFGGATNAVTDLGVSDYTLVIETSDLTTSNLADGTRGELYGSGVVLKAPEGATMVTPATTMVTAIMTADPTNLVTAADAMADVAVALGFSATLDLNNFDAYKAPTGTAAEITAAKTLQFNMQQSNEQVMAVVKSLTSAGESSGVSSADAYNVALKAVIDVVADKIVALDGGAAAGGSTTLLNFTTDLAAIVVDIKGKIANTTGYDATKAASFTAIANNAETGLNVAVSQIKALAEPTTALEIAANAAVLSAVNVITAQIEAAAEVITGGGTLVAAQALVTIIDDNSFDTVKDNPAPTGMTLSGSTEVDSVENVTIAENAASLVVGTVAGIDGKTTAGVAVGGAVVANETFTYAIVGGPTVPLFTINATTGVLSLVAQPDYETMGTNKFYDVSVSVTDSGGKSVVETFKVNVSDVVESGGFGISSDLLVFTDYNPLGNIDITNTVLASTTGTAVTIGSATPSIQLNKINMVNFTNDSFVGTAKSPNLKFTLDSTPIGNGVATIKATITDGSNATRTGIEDQISLTVTVAYQGDGTTGKITVPAGTATGTYDKGDGTSVAFSLANIGVDAYSITAANAVTGMPASLDVKLGELFDAFVNAGGASNIIQEGSYHVAIETTLPLENAANETVTTFGGVVTLVTATTKDTLIGTDGADTLVGGNTGQLIYGGLGGYDTISLGSGTDYLYLQAGSGGSTSAYANTLTGFSNGTDKFMLGMTVTGQELTFNDLTIAQGTTAADTLISITATSATSTTSARAEEFMFHVTGVAASLIDTYDFVLDVA